MQSREHIGYRMMIRSGLWAFLGKGGNQIVNFILVITLARLLTPEAFGVVAAAQVILVVCQSVVNFGLGVALIQTDKLTPSMERTAATLMLGMALIIAFLIHFSTPLFAQLMSIPQLIEVMPVMLLTFFLSAATNPGTNLLMREMRFKLLALIDIGTFTLLNAVIAISLALNDWSYWAIIWAALAGTAAKAVLIWHIRPTWPTLRMQRTEIRTLLGFGSGVFLSNLMITLAQKADNIVVSATMGASSLGAYARGYALLEMVNGLFGWALNAVLFSGFSKQRRENIDRKAQQRTFLLSQSLVGILAIPFMVLFGLLNNEIVAVVLGPQWNDTADLLEIFALGLFFRLSYKAAIPVPKAEGRVFLIASLNALHAAVVAVAALLASSYGMIAIAWGVLFALALHYFLVINFAIGILSISYIAYFRRLMFLIPATAPALFVSVMLLSLCKEIIGDGLFDNLLIILITFGGFLVTYLVTLKLMIRVDSVKDLVDEMRGFYLSLRIKRTSLK